MVTRVRIEGYGDDVAELQAEIDAVLSHMWGAGIWEGVIPRSMNVEDEHFHRLKGDEMEVKFGDGGRISFEFSGRKQVEFVPAWLGVDPRIEFQDDYRVFRADAYAAANRIDNIDVQQAVIVLPRRLWPSHLTARMRTARETVTPSEEASVYEVTKAALAEPDMLEPRKVMPTPAAGELAAFTELALDPCVEEIGFGISKRRDGYEIDMTWTVPTGSTDPSEPSAVGGRGTYFGETFLEAVQAAKAELVAAQASTSVARILPGGVGMGGLRHE